MKIYFLKVDGKYIHKNARMEPPFRKLLLTHTNNEARYWDSIGSVKGLNTKLHNSGIKSCIVECNVEESKLFGEFIE